jgi:hypothetical protein
MGVLHDWWQPMLNNPAWIRKREYEAHATLTVGRALYVLEYGGIVSKPVAARWAQQALDERRVKLIDRANRSPIA